MNPINSCFATPLLLRKFAEVFNLKPMTVMVDQNTVNYIVDVAPENYEVFEAFMKEHNISFSPITEEILLQNSVFNEQVKQFRKDIAEGKTDSQDSKNP